MIPAVRVGTEERDDIEVLGVVKEFQTTLLPNEGGPTLLLGFESIGPESFAYDDNW